MYTRSYIGFQWDKFSNDPYNVGYDKFHSRIAFYVDEQFLQDLTTNNRIDVKERLIFERLIF